MDKASDPHASLILKEAAETFFLVHSDVLRLDKHQEKVKELQEEVGSDIKPEPKR